MNNRPYELYISLDDLAPLWTAQSDWENEPPLRAAAISLELCFLLIADSVQDSRPAARKEERIGRLFRCAAAKLRLLGELCTKTPPPQKFARDQFSTGSHLRALHDLAPRLLSLGVPPRLLRQWADAYDATFDELPFLFGLEPDVNRLRAAFGAPTHCAREGLPILPHDAFAAPATLTALFSRHDFNAEDRLFAATHQITECWSFIMLRALGAAESSAQNGEIGAAIRPLSQASAILAHLSEMILILETMVLRDYHPLRVRLRDASGAQSRQIAAAIASIQKLHALLDAARARRSTSFLTIFRAPDAHLAEHGFLEALTTLEHRMASFYFTHYKLAVRVLGAKSLGSLGVEVETLIDRFVKPLCPALDEARYRHNVITSFAYGKYAGALVSALERDAPEPRPSTTGAAVDETRIRAVVKAYFDAMAAMDLERWVGLFAADGSIESPVGSRPFRGRTALRVFFRNFIKAFAPSAVVTEKAARIDAERGHAEVDWQIDVRHGGMPISYAGTDLFDIASNGELLRVVVHDDPRDIARQMLTAEENEEFPLQD